MNGDGDHGGNELILIVSFDKHKTAYYIDLLLPVKLTKDNWIGIIFRDNKPISICIDCNDIRTKSKLFDATCDVEQYEWMENEVTRLTIHQMPSLQKHKPYNQYNHNLGQQRRKFVLREATYR